jgi:hypothetical protein
MEFGRIIKASFIPLEGSSEGILIFHRSRKTSFLTGEQITRWLPFKEPIKMVVSRPTLIRFVWIDHLIRNRVIGSIKKALP